MKRIYRGSEDSGLEKVLLRVSQESRKGGSEVVQRSPGDSQTGQKFLSVLGSLGKPGGVWRDLGYSEG